MIDTLKLRSPSISEELAQEVQRHLTLRCGIEQGGDGDVLYALISGALGGSWESSVSVNVLRDEFVVIPAKKVIDERTGVEIVVRERAKTIKQQCDPYLVIEGSAHKAMLGHNVFGGPQNIASTASWFIGDVGSRFEMDFPSWDLWRILRLDWAEVYDVGTFEGVAQYVHGLGIARYPRRQPRRYGDECVFFAGTTTSTKFYHKGPEFAKNGYSKLARATNQGYATNVQNRANAFLRTEVSIKSKKLRAQHGENPHPQDVSPDWVWSLFDVEVARVLKDGESDMEWVRTADEVEARLYSVYDAQRARNLFGTWLALAAQGESAVRARLTRPTYYRHRKQLSDVGVAWDSTDVFIREDSLIPAGFRPTRSDPRRLTDEDPIVQECLLGHPVAV